MMSLSIRILVLAALFHNSQAAVTFTDSKLFDEKDFATRVVSVSNFCEYGCRIYASVPEASADVSKQIVIHDSVDNILSLYSISQLKDGNQKGYHEVWHTVKTVNFTNTNPHFATAPMAVWIVRGDAANINEHNIYEAANLNTLPDSLGVVTVMSAEPFTLRSTTDGPMKVIATLTGFDAVNPESPDDCFDVFNEMNETLYTDVQVAVHSPIITFYFDDVDYRHSNVHLEAEIGNHLDFSGLSFVTTPGYIGCNGNQKFRSSLYEAITSYKYQSSNWLYDVEVTPMKLNTDAAHPVTITDSTNSRQITWSGTGPVDTDTIEATNNLEFSWAEDDQNPDQLVFIQVKPTKSSTGEVCLGFGGSSCYLIGPVSESFEEAVKICENLNATVASVHSAQKDSFIRRLAVSSGLVNGLYLGATLNVNVFLWMDGSEWNYINFYAGYPQFGEGNCLAMDTSSSLGKWMNVDCSSNLSVACERK